MKNFSLILLFLIIVSFFASPVSFAQSEYVLPYPSSMPGSKFYVISSAWDTVMKYWHFGVFSQFFYNLKQSDKYLVEAKTLFEYKQYLLAYTALQKSDEYFEQAKIVLKEAAKQQRNLEEKRQTLKQAALKHREVLLALRSSVPENFLWQPEKAVSSSLDIEQQISEAIRLRESCL